AQQQEQRTQRGAQQARAPLSGRRPEARHRQRSRQRESQRRGNGERERDAGGGHRQGLQGRLQQQRKKVARHRRRHEASEKAAHHFHVAGLEQRGGMKAR